MNTSPIKDVPRLLFKKKPNSFNLKISKIRSSHHRNVSTDPLASGRRSVGNRGANFGNDCTKRRPCGFLHPAGKVTCLQPAEFSAVSWETEVAHFPETSEQTHYLSLCKNLEDPYLRK